MNRHQSFETPYREHDGYLRVEIVLYGMPWCEDTTRIKRALETRNIPYTLREESHPNLPDGLDEIEVNLDQQMFAPVLELFPLSLVLYNPEEEHIDNFVFQHWDMVSRIFEQ